MDKYILNNNDEPILCNDIFEWGKWFENSWPQRQVDKTIVGNHVVSTVFLAIDHNYTGHGNPVLYETMVFTDYYGEFLEIEEEHEHCSTWRVSTKDEAVKVHKQVVDALLKAYKRGGNVDIEVIGGTEK